MKDIHCIYCGKLVVELPSKYREEFPIASTEYAEAMMREHWENDQCDEVEIRFFPNGEVAY